VNPLTELKANLILSRPPMYRERASRTYSSFIYLISLISIELPYVLINTVTFVYVRPSISIDRTRTHADA
jgi:ABC-type multidrug transport system permease subunit